MVQIKWLKDAKIDLKEVFEYISLDSKRYARLQVERIKLRTGILKTHPKSGKIVLELENSKIREVIEGNYRIIYKIVNEKRIDILLVHHGAKDLKRRIINI